MEKLENGLYVGERALFNSSNLEIYNSVFEDGESPLKESDNLYIEGCTFRWKYPLWYCENVSVKSSTLELTARSGIWYTRNIEMHNCQIGAPKTFRRAEGIKLFNCSIPTAKETMWYCKDIELRHVSLVGDYFGLCAEGVYAEFLDIDGNYAFDGGKNIEIHNARLISKDAFWNAENVTVYDSVIVGEYLGWNSKNVRFVNCRIESNQGMCYMENLVLENCEVVNTDLAFEYSSVDADIITEIDSVKNPISGRIRAKAIKELIMEKGVIDPSKTEIITEG